MVPGMITFVRLGKRTAVKLFQERRRSFFQFTDLKPIFQITLVFFFFSFTSKGFFCGRNLRRTTLISGLLLDFPFSERMDSLQDFQHIALLRFE